MRVAAHHDRAGGRYRAAGVAWCAMVQMTEPNTGSGLRVLGSSCMRMVLVEHAYCVDTWGQLVRTMGLNQMTVPHFGVTRSWKLEHQASWTFQISKKLEPQGVDDKAEERRAIDQDFNGEDACR